MLVDVEAGIAGWGSWGGCRFWPELRSSKMSEQSLRRVLKAGESGLWRRHPEGLWLVTLPRLLSQVLESSCEDLAS